MSHLYYLVGPPGSGKRTVGKALSALSGAALLDNHLANEVWELCFAVRKAIRAATLHAPRALAHIFTNYLTAEEREWRNVERLHELAAKRGVPFVPVWLECPLPEQERRMLLPERAERLKLRDPAQLRELMPPDALVLDTSTLQPAESAQQSVEFAQHQPQADSPLT